MTDLTREQIEALLERADRYATSIPTTDNYRFLLVSDLIAALRSTMTALVEAQAAQAGSVEEAARIAKNCVYQSADPVPPILALADPTGVKLLSELRQRVANLALHAANLADQLAEARKREDIVNYVLQDPLHNRLVPRVIDIAYSAFMSAKRPNDEDGGPSDWFTDTRPMVMAKIEEIRRAALAAAHSAYPLNIP